MAHYNLIFQGRIIDGASLDEVKNNISRLFKTDTAKTDALFSGKSIIIKKNLDTESTKKYLAIIKKAGAIVKAVKIESSEKPSTPITETSHTTNNSTASKTTNNLSSGLASLVNYNSSTSESTDADKKSNEQSIRNEEKGLQLAPVGSDIPTSSNKQNDIEAPDISHLSMSEAETGSLEEFAQTVEAIVLPDIDKLTMSEANTGSMEEFAVKVDAVELPDISDLNVATQDDTPLSAQSQKKHLLISLIPVIYLCLRLRMGHLKALELNQKQLKYLIPPTWKLKNKKKSKPILEKQSSRLIKRKLPTTLTKNLHFISISLWNYNQLKN